MPAGSAPERLKDNKEPRRLLRAEFRTQWTILTVALLLLGGILWYSLLQVRRSIERDQVDRLRNQARLIDANLVQQLDSTNSALEGVIRALRAAGGRAEAASLDSDLKALEQSMPGVRTLVVVGPDGRVRFSNREQLLGMDLSDRAYFRAARAGLDPAKLYLSAPFRSRLGAYVMNLSRVMVGRDGEFLGIATASLDQSFFNVLLSSSLYTRDTGTRVVHADGTEFLALPSRGSEAGQNLRLPGSFFSKHVGSQEKETFFTGRSVSTGKVRMIAQRTVCPSQVKSDACLVVGVSREVGAVFARWRHEAQNQAALYCLLALASVAGLAWYQRGKRQTAKKIFRDEQVIRRLNEDINRFFDMSISLLCITDAKGNFLRVNKAWEDVLGYRAEDLNGVRFLGLVHEDDRASTADAADSLVVGAPMRGFVNRFRHRDGTYHWVEWHAVSFASQTVYVVAQDVTDRRLLEAEREELISSLTKALESVKTLKGLIPICAWCKKIRGDTGYWQQLESYLTENSEAMLTHGMCPECQTKFAAEVEEMRSGR